MENEIEKMVNDVHRKVAKRLFELNFLPSFVSYVTKLDYAETREVLIEVIKEDIKRHKKKLAKDEKTSLEEKK